MHTLPWSFVRILGLQLGLEGMGPSWATSGRHFHSLTEGRKGAAGAASMLYCFPPGTLFLLERPKWYSCSPWGRPSTGTETVRLSSLLRLDSLLRSRIRRGCI